jgi:hypothetical protein
MAPQLYLLRLSHNTMILVINLNMHFPEIRLNYPYFETIVTKWEVLSLVAVGICVQCPLKETLRCE